MGVVVVVVTIAVVVNTAVVVVNDVEAVAVVVVAESVVLTSLQRDSEPKRIPTNLRLLRIEGDIGVRITRAFPIFTNICDAKVNKKIM